MFEIKTSSNIPDSTYFTMSDVSPEFDPITWTVTIFDGKGSRRSWGAPQVNSTVVVNNDDFVAVHVGFSHKHRGGQGWFYFNADERITWAKLSDEQRQLVLDAKKPSWAKVPGKLSSQKQKPAANIQTAYKLVKVLDDGRMVSLYDNKTVYSIGKRLTQKAQDDHNGGFYAYPSVEGMMALWSNKELVPKRCYEDVNKVAVLEVEISGTIVKYGGKVAATYLRPVKVLEIREVANS